MPHWLSPGHALRPRRPRFGGLPAVLAALLLFAGAAYLAARLDPLPPRFSGDARASDGDSLWVGRDRVRLLGLDAPELDQVCWRGDGAEWPCGGAARSRLAEMLARGDVVCAPEGQDRYGRTLASCAVVGSDLGAELVRAGLAISTGGYGAEEAAARTARRGLWSGRFVDPKEWRDEGPQADPGPGLMQLFWAWFRELTGATALR